MFSDLTHSSALYPRAAGDTPGETLTADHTIPMNRRFRNCVLHDIMNSSNGGLKAKSISISSARDSVEGRESCTASTAAQKRQLPAKPPENKQTDKNKTTTKTLKVLKAVF